MLLYDFNCENCGPFEQMRELNDENNVVNCPTCGEMAKRIFSPPSFCRTFSGTRQMLSRLTKRGREPLVVREGEGDPLESALPKPHSHDIHHCGGHGSPGYAPWMIKH